MGCTRYPSNTSTLPCRKKGGDGPSPGGVPPDDSIPLFADSLQHREEPPDDGCDNPDDDGDYKGFAPADVVEFPQGNQPGNPCKESSKQPVAQKGVADGVDYRPDEGGDQGRVYSFLFAKEPGNDVDDDP